MSRLADFLRSLLPSAPNTADHPPPRVHAGLRDGHREVVFPHTVHGRTVRLTVRTEGHVDIDVWRRALEAAAPEAVVPYGRITTTEPDGLLGLRRFAVALLVPSPVRSTELVALPLHASEVATLDRAGPTRLLARLGDQAGRFPYATACDPERPTTTPPDPTPTALDRVVGHFDPRLSVTRTGDRAAVLQVPPDLLARLPAHEPDRAVRLLGVPAPSARAIAVLSRPGEPVKALSTESTIGHVALGGLVLAFADADAAVFTDDLLLLSCTASTWAKLQEAATTGGMVRCGDVLTTWIPVGHPVYLPSATGVARALTVVRPPLQHDAFDAEALAAHVDAVLTVLDGLRARGHGTLHASLGAPHHFRFDGPILADPGQLETCLAALHGLPPVAGADGWRFSLALAFSDAALQ
jgi:hypothetical protein